MIVIVDTNIDYMRCMCCNMMNHIDILQNDIPGAQFLKFYLDKLENIQQEI